MPTRDRMLHYADTYWAPRWRDGALSYPRQDQFKRTGDAPDVWRRVQPLTGNALIGLARLDHKDGLYTLFNSPFESAHQSEPFITRIDPAAVDVTRAVYDKDKRALIVSLRSRAPAHASPATFTAMQLRADTRYAMWIDGVRKPLAVVQGRADVALALNGDATIIIAAE